MSAATRVPASPSLWERATGRAWSTGGGITVRQPWEPERPREEVPQALQPLSPSAPATEFPLSALREQLSALQWQTEMAELTAREALARRTGFFSPAAVVGSWDAQATLDDLRAAQAANTVYASVDALAAAMRAQLAVLASARAPGCWRRGGPDA
jgi:hypothetical protein